MLRRLWRLLQPFHWAFTGCLIMLVVREALQIAEGYSLSGAVRLFEGRAAAWIWVTFLAGLLLLDEIRMRLDNTLNYHVTARQSYPLFRFLKSTALCKLLSLDLA